MNFNIFLLVVNRVDLLKIALDSIEAVWDRVIVIDNTTTGFELQQKVEIFRPSVPLTFSQSQNLMQIISEERSNDVLMSMHDDAYLTDQEAILEFIAFAEEQFNKDEKVGVVGADYDHLIAYRMKTVQDVGRWDTFLPQYGSDEDWFLRAKKAGWKEEACCDVAKRLVHGISMTIKSDPEFNFKTQLLQTHWVMKYLECKWGVDREYDLPFQEPKKTQPPLLF